MTAHHSSTLKPLKDNVFVTDLDHGMKLTQGGVILLDDNGKDHGIRERWGRVAAIGPEVEDLRVGEWILIKHGRWTNKLSFSDCDMWRVEYPDSVLLVSEEDPREKAYKPD